MLTLERYDQAGMRAVRRRAVEAAAGAASFGLVLGTLGRQGNPRILDHLQSLLSRRGIPYTNVRAAFLLCYYQKYPTAANVLPLLLSGLLHFLQ